MPDHAVRATGRGASTSPPEYRSYRRPGLHGKRAFAPEGSGAHLVGASAAPAVRTREKRTGDIGSDGAQDLGDEDEGVAAADAGLRDTAVAVAELGGDGQQKARADALAHEAVVPAADDHADADLEVQRLAAVVGVVEDVAAPDLAQVVGHDRVAGLDHLAVAGVEHLDLQSLGGLGPGEGERGLGTLGTFDGGHVDIDHADYRSEERRVGKECRSRWSPYH